MEMSKVNKNAEMSFLVQNNWERGRKQVSMSNKDGRKRQEIF